MFDAAHTGLDCGHCALVPVRVRLDGHISGPGLLDDDADFVLTVDLSTGIGIGCAGTFRCQDLDPVHAVRQIHLHGASDSLNGRYASHEI